MNFRIVGDLTGWGVIVRTIQRHGWMADIRPGVVATDGRPQTRDRPEIQRNQDDATREECRPGGGQIFSLASSSFRSLWRNRSMIRAGSGRGMGIKEPSGSRSPSATGNEDAAYKARLTKSLDVPPPTDAAKRSLQNKFLTNHWLTAQLTNQ